MFKAKRSQLVELVIGTNITGNNQQVYFQNQPQLQSISGQQKIYIKKIKTFTDDFLSGSPLSSNTVATAADIINAVLVLSVDGENAFNMIPLVDLLETQSTTNTPWNWQPFLMKNVCLVDWTKSYVQVITAPGGTPFSYIFEVFYDYEPDPEAALTENGNLVFSL